MKNLNKRIEVLENGISNGEIEKIVLRSDTILYSDGNNHNDETVLVTYASIDEYDEFRTSILPIDLGGYYLEEEILNNIQEQYGKQKSEEIVIPFKELKEKYIQEKKRIDESKAKK